MGRPQRVDDRTLLAAARRVFLERGPAATTRGVARAAGVSQAVIYQRFRSKDELFLAAMLPAPPELSALLGDEDDATRGDVSEYLVEVALRALVYFAEAAPSFFQVVAHPAFRGEVFARLHEHVPLVVLLDGLVERLHALRRRGLVGDVDLRAASEGLIGYVHNLAVFGAMAGHVWTADAARNRVAAFVETLWRGLAPPSTR